MTILSVISILLILLCRSAAASSSPSFSYLSPSPSPSLVTVSNEQPPGAPPRPRNDSRRQESLGIPGTRLTKDGYDNEYSKNPICWRSGGLWKSQENENETEPTSYAFPNELYDDFRFTGQVQLLPTCPGGVVLNVTTPFMVAQNLLNYPNQELPSPMATKWYNYTIQGSIDLDQLQDQVDMIVSDFGWTISFQVLLCDLEVTAFCSPFVHEQANEREGPNRTQTKVGDLHGGSHIHSPIVLYPVDPTQRIFHFNVSIPTLINTPGMYFLIGAIQMFVNDTMGVTHRYDIANAASDRRIWEYERLPKILEVRPIVEITVWVATGLVSMFLLCCAWQCWKHRNHQVLKLSQGSFLLVSLLAGVWAMLSLNLIAPKNDIYCNWKFPMILIPLQLVKSITIGRLWRIEMLISPLLQDTCDYNNKLGATFRYVLTQIAQGGCFWSICGCRGKPGKNTSKQHKLRRTISWYQVARIVVVLTLPQVVLMVAGAIFQPSTVDTAVVKGAEIGRLQCQSSSRSFRHLCLYGFWLLVATNAILLIVAQACKTLPSLFNEVGTIHAATVIDSILTLTVVCVSIVATGPSTSPEVGFLLWVTFLTTIILNSTIRMVWPKLTMIWNGETVIVSKLVADHREARRKSNAASKHLEDPRLKGVTGFSPTMALEKPNHAREESSASTDTVPCDGLSGSLVFNSPVANNGSIQRQRSGGLGQLQSVRPPARVSDETERASIVAKSFVFRVNEAPDQDVLVPMLQMQKQLEKVNAKVTSGRGVTEEEWMDIVEESATLHKIFQSIQFEDRPSPSAHEHVHV